MGYLLVGPQLFSDLSAPIRTNLNRPAQHRAAMSPFLSGDQPMIETALFAHPATRGSNNNGEERKHSFDERTRRRAIKSISCRWAG